MGSPEDVLLLAISYVPSHDPESSSGDVLDAKVPSSANPPPSFSGNEMSA